MGPGVAPFSLPWKRLSAIKAQNVIDIKVISFKFKLNIESVSIFCADFLLNLTFQIRNRSVFMIMQI